MVFGPELVMLGPNKQFTQLACRVANPRGPFNVCFFFHFVFSVVVGPELVMLSPDEQITQLSLPGDKPKRPL